MTYSVQSPPFVTGTAIVAADHNANWTGVETYINAIITGANMDANSIGTTQLQPTCVTTAKIATGAVTNNEINAAAAIALSKLATTGTMTATTFVGALTGNASTATLAATVTTNANLTGDITSVGNATAIAPGVILDADVNAGANIAASKLLGVQKSQSGNNNSTTFSTGSPTGGIDGDIWFKYV